MDKAVTEKSKTGRVDILYSHEFWDGPLTGVCNYDGHKFWFLYFDGAVVTNTPRIFAVYELTVAEWLLEERYLDYQENEGDEVWPGHHRSDHFNYRLPIGYFDMADKRLRPTRYRDYFVHNDKCYSPMHKASCPLGSICIVWRDDAVNLELPNIAESSSSWCVLFGKEYLTVRFCSWCGVELPEKMPIMD